MHDELPQHHSNPGFLIALTIVGVMAIGFAWLFKSAMKPEVSPQIGKQFPVVEAEGWINGDKPSAEDLRDHVIVFDAWAHWCRPCRIATPELIEVYEKFKDRGVIFIGLTSEGLDLRSLKNSREYVTSLKIPWVNGYGATKTLSALEVESIPQLWVVDRQNRIVLHEMGWSGYSAHDIEDALTKALESP